MKMRKPDNATQIEDTWVAEKTAIRQLRSETWLVNKANSEAELVLLYRALEVEIVQNPLEYPDKIDFSWRVLGFNEDFFWI